MRLLFIIIFSTLFFFSCETKNRKQEGSFAVEEKKSQPDGTNQTDEDKSEEWDKGLSKEQKQKEFRQIFIAQFLENPLDTAVYIPHWHTQNTSNQTFISGVRKGQKMKVGEKYSTDVIFHHYDDDYDDYFVVFQKEDDFFLMYSPEMLTKETADLQRGDTITLHLSSTVDEYDDDKVNEYIAGLTLKAKGKYHDFLSKEKKDNIKLTATSADVNHTDLQSKIAYALSSSDNSKIQKIIESNLPIKVIATKYRFAIDDFRIPGNQEVSFYHAKLYVEGEENRPFVELLISDVAQDGDNLSIYVMEDAKSNSNEIRKIKRISIY